MLLACLMGCAAPPREVSAPNGPRDRPVAGVPADEVRAALDALRRGQVPTTIDRLVQDLRAAADAEIRGPRYASALRGAADLLAARYRLRRDPRDLEGSAALLNTLSEQASPHDACSARAALAELRASAGDVAGARFGYRSYLRTCPGEAGAAHVQASLTLLDPPVARAEAQARAARLSPPGADRRGPAWLRRIVVDAGHGGSDPGARGPDGLAESTVTLDIARRLADRLADSLQIDVVLTRDQDVFVSLEERTERANAVHADLFVSIHCNSSANPLSRGVAMYVLDAADDRVAARVARRDNGAFESDALAAPDVFRILADLRLTGAGGRSVEIARSLQRGLVGTLSASYDNIMDLGVHPARFHVLVGARMPAVLAEVSFVSNAAEEQRLADPRYREAVATALADGLTRLQ